MTKNQNAFRVLPNVFFEHKKRCSLVLAFTSTPLKYLTALLLFLIFTPFQAATQINIEAPPNFVVEQFNFDQNGKVEQVKIKSSIDTPAEEYSVEIIDGYVIMGGDIVLGKEEELLKAKAAILNLNNAKWTNGIIPYTIQANHPTPDVIKYSINYIIENTNICMVPRTSQANYVEFIDAGGCFSSVGMVGGKQDIGLNQNCGIGACIHEILHAAGHWHEQSRQDRDNFVEINFENIESDKAFNFDKYSVGADIGDYDFNSIMHYGKTAFSTNGQSTIDFKTPPVTFATNIAIGQRLGMSSGDIAAVNGAYGAMPSCNLIGGLPVNLKIKAFPSISIQGTDVNFSGIVIENTGSSSSPATKVYTLRFTPGDPFSQILNESNVPAIAAGGEYSVPASMFDAASLDDNLYTFGVWVDVFNQIAEGYEFDNVYFWDNPVLTLPLAECLANVVINSNTSGTTIASNSISTNGNVQVVGNAIFSAPEITLNAGFSVPAGNTFSTSSGGNNNCFNGESVIRERSNSIGDSEKVASTNAEQLSVIPNPTTGLTNLVYQLA
ncbi:MAG: M12 family metallopeptidase, partial [Saprospiraceae bacterium]